MDSITSEELRALSQVSAWRNVVAISTSAAGLAAAFLGSLRWPHAWVIAPAGIWIAREQFRLAVLSHEAVHFRLFRRRPINDFFGAAISAPLFFPFATYRGIHLEHHKSPLHATDPALPMTGTYPKKRLAFAGLVIQDLLGISYVKLAWFVLGRRSGPGARIANSNPTTLAAGLLAQVVLFLLFRTTGQTAFCFLLWWGPALTVLQLFTRVRAVVEHAGYPASEDQRLSTRTIVNPLQAFFLGPCHVNYHIEHHLYPSIPWYRLPDAHRALGTRGALPERHVYSSYFSVFSELLN